MLLGGLWHGAAYNFILWGAYHGLLLILMRNVISEEKFSSKMVIQIFINFHLIVLSWLLFRVTDIDNFMDYTHGLFAFTGGTALSPLLYFILTIAILSHFTPRKYFDRLIEEYFNTAVLPVKAAVYTGLIFTFIGASIGTPAFIYFQF